MKVENFILRCVCLLFFVLQGGMAWAVKMPDFHVGDLAYNILSKEARTVEVTYDRYHDVSWGYKIDNSTYVSGDIVIPQRIIYGGTTYTVVAIGERAFEECDALTSVVIPNSVTTIGDSAFNRCFALVSVEIPNSVTTIGDEAFGRCSSLTSLEIPNSVTTIGDRAFRICSSLTSLEIPNSVTTIGDMAFCDCDALTSVEIPNSVTAIGDGAFSSCSSLEIFVDSSNQHYTSIDGVLYTIHKDTLITCPGGKTSVEIPNGVVSIDEGAFTGCSSLISVKIPSSISAIGDFTFRNCSSLAFVELDNGVTAIGEGAFFDCDALISVEIPSSVTTIGDEAFFQCFSLTSVELPNVTSIGDYAFYNCSSLASVEIGDSVTTIGYGAFRSSSIRTIYCRMPEPIECSPVFSDDALMYATLYVPTGTKAAYGQVDPWRNFWNIEEMDFEDATAIESVTADGTEASVTTENGVIVLEGDSRLPVEVYSVGGQCLYRGTERRIAGLPNGVYVVKIGNRSQKIVL